MDFDTLTTPIQNDVNVKVESVVDTIVVYHLLLFHFDFDTLSLGECQCQSSHGRVKAYE